MGIEAVTGEQLGVHAGFDDAAALLPTVPEPFELVGTPGDDVVELVALATPGQWSVTLNGVEQPTGPDAANVRFDASGGDDTVRIVAG